METAPSSFLFITLATASSKSSCVTCILLSLKAYIPASVQTPLISAPEQPFIFSAIFIRSIPLVRFMDLEWIFKMSVLAFSVGGGNSIFLSILPGLKRAGSRMSNRLVAMMILISLVDSKPSNWFNSSNIVLCTSESPPPEELSTLEDPMESISSMKMIDGACSLAITNSSLTILEPSPMYF
ncbi:hypothetical protein OGAPHI_002369 [Ogataea philodendri]|uniref:Uncharacterized protein n=1 Tax=Ogataea philodendri TaxID=1378263 RepID=A0A9P8T7X6_9ASCO|nr:uncharacterized protein OGAPHI_002369 [Ogataea philodendri]KAH3668615.1 hypothetical protein OGAPHI_002369 [Ogataea philodendri]